MGTGTVDLFEKVAMMLVDNETLVLAKADVVRLLSLMREADAAVKLTDAAIAAAEATNAWYAATKNVEAMTTLLKYAGVAPRE